MARIRYIKPDAAADTKLAEVSRDARLMYRDLWCHMDCQGLTEDDPRLIKRNIFPYDEDIGAAKVAQLVDELVSIDRLRRVEWNGRKLLLCPSFAAHQKFHHSEKPKYSIPDEYLSALVQPPSDPGPERINAGAKRIGIGIGIGTGTQPEAAPLSPENLKAEIQEAGEVWQKTLEDFGVTRKLSALEQNQIGRAIQSLGAEMVRLAVEGVRYEKKSKDFNRSDHLNLARILDKERIQSHANRASAERRRRQEHDDRRREAEATA